MSHRFTRTELLIGSRHVARLRGVRVAVFGLGAVGSYAVEALARAGVGYLRLVDFDVVRETNFNRQLYALESTLGMHKAQVAADRVHQINPACDVDMRIAFVDGASSPELLSGIDVAVDAIDGVSPKVYLMRAAVQAGVPLVSSMGAASRLDPWSVRVGDVSESVNCPLARHVRKKLHKLGVRTGIRCVYSIEPAVPSSVAAAPEPDLHDRGRPRRPVGSISYMTGLFGLIAASEALRIVLGEDVIPASGAAKGQRRSNPRPADRNVS